MKASFNGNDKIVERLIAGGVDLNLRNKVSLHCAIEYKIYCFL